MVDVTVSVTVADVGLSARLSSSTVFPSLVIDSLRNSLWELFLSRRLAKSSLADNSYLCYQIMEYVCKG